MLKITVLGSGNFIPAPNRHSSGHLFQTKKEDVIFDFGRGTIDNLLKKGFGGKSIVAKDMDIFTFK